ncbi:MAG: Uma2 family endonuclease [Deinococcales bacterium]|nr:Uma2 family endonuclease [Chitinophagaceae bacterium]
MAAAIKILPHYLYDDYCNWEGKWELIYGIPYAMSPAPTTKHQRIAAALNAIFYVGLKKCKHCKIYQPIDYKVADDTIIQPDLSIICGKPKLNYLDFAPGLVVEVLSPATALKDRHTKYGIYENNGVKYYLIVSPDNEEIEVFELIDGAYQLKEKGHAFTFLFSFDEDCEAAIDFTEIW